MPHALLTPFLGGKFSSRCDKERYSCIERVQVTTLGQPLEVLKTQMAANRSQTMLQACKTVWSRGGAVGFYQGLIPWVQCQIMSLFFLSANGVFLGMD
jgi:hypothetical protein